VNGANAASYSIVQSGSGLCAACATCPAADPLFVSASTDNFRLSSGSPGIDAGFDNDITTHPDSYDIDQDGGVQDVLPDRDGFVRIRNGVAGSVCDFEVDIGAYEFASTGCTGDIVVNNAVNVDDLLAVINGWGPCIPAQTCPADIAPVGGLCPHPDNVVNVDDLLMVINSWGCCPGFPGCASANDSIPQNLQDCMNYCNSDPDYGTCMDACLDSLCKQGYTQYCD